MFPSSSSNESIGNENRPSRNRMQHHQRAQSLLVSTAIEEYAVVAQDLLQNDYHSSRISEARDVVKRIAEIKEAFENVRMKWSELLNVADINREQVGKYYAGWKRLSEEFNSTALEMSRLAAQGGAIIKDFSTSFLYFLKDDGATMEQKREQLKKFKNKLFSAETRDTFGKGGETMYALAEKISRLRMDVLEFEFSMQLNGISGQTDLPQEVKTLEAKIKELEEEVAKMEIEHVDRSRLSGVVAVLTMIGGRREIPSSEEVSLKLSAINFPFHDERCKLKQSIREHKETLKQKMDGQDVQFVKLWENHLRTCGEQISSISDHLCAVSMVWTALCADTAELDTQLGLVASKDLHEDLFRRRLGSTIDMYTRLQDVLSELARGQLGARGQPGTRGQPNNRSVVSLRPTASSYSLRPDRIGAGGLSGSPEFQNGASTSQMDGDDPSTPKHSKSSRTPSRRTTKSGRSGVAATDSVRQDRSNDTQDTGSASGSAAPTDNGRSPSYTASRSNVGIPYAEQPQPPLPHVRNSNSRSEDSGKGASTHVKEEVETPVAKQKSQSASKSPSKKPWWKYLFCCC